MTKTNVKQFHHQNCTIHCGPEIGRDNCVMLKSGKIMIIKEVTGDKFNALVFKTCVPLVNYPIDSRTVGVFRVCDTVSIEGVPVTTIHCKMIILPMDNVHVVIKLLHT